MCFTTFPAISSQEVARKLLRLSMYRAKKSPCIALLTSSEEADTMSKITFQKGSLWV